MNYIEIENICKAFSKELYGNGLTFRFGPHSPNFIKGVNGSGKSTLLGIISGHITQDRGAVKYWSGGKLLNGREIFRRTAMVSPYFNPYGEMTPEQLAKFVSNGADRTYSFIMKNYGIFGVDMKLNYGAMSTGHRQRVKICLAFNDRTEFILLDEPMTGLDDTGKDIFMDILLNHRDRMIIIASNSNEEICLCSKGVDLD